MSVNKAAMRLWVDALRSGDYGQTTGVLCNGKDYCCLGVACEVAIKDGVDVLRTPKAGECGVSGCGTCASVSYDGEGAVLPSSVCQWLGISALNPTLKAPGECGVTATASTANDTHKWSFAQIADAIENTFLTDGEDSM